MKKGTIPQYTKGASLFCMKEKSPPRRAWRSVIPAVFLLTLIIFSSLTLCGCSTNFRYDNYDKYTVGEAAITDIVRAVDVEWISGDIEFDFNGNPSDGIVFTESSKKGLSEALSLHYWLDGTTLRLKFAASGKANFNGISKKLKVIIPSDVTLTELNINGVSSNIKLDGARADSIYVNSVSGNISASDIRAGESVSLASTSGNVKGKILVACKSLKMASVSGNISFSTEARVRELSTETVSGNVFLSNLNPAKSGLVDTVSGDVELEFLDNSGFEISYETVSGDIVSDFNVYVHDSKYVYGTPNSAFKVKTVSGDLLISRSPT